MKVAIVHFRSGPGVRDGSRIKIDSGESAGTDGVSLEMAKRAKLLSHLGHEPLIVSAYDWADLPIPELEFERKDVVELMHGLFDVSWEKTSTGEMLEASARIASERILQAIRRTIGEAHPDLIFVHNIFSLPIHPAATVALADFVRESGIPCAAIHHDVRSEGAYKFTPTCHYARRLLVDYFPPEMRNLRHWAINTRDRDFFRERGIPAEVVHDTLDFGTALEPAEKRRLRKKLRNLWKIGEDDIVLLLSTRIVPNKQAEIAGQLVRGMETIKRDFLGRFLPVGSQVTEKTRVVLVVAGRPERAFHWYRQAVFEFLRELSIDWKYVGDSVMPRRDERSGMYALYPDTYAAADFALYPTRWEGFGNQFLEIVASRLPVAVYEYPVFRRDIAPLGFEITSLGRRTTRPLAPRKLASLPKQRLASAARHMWEILVDQDTYRETTEHNFKLGSANFGLSALERHLREVIAWAEKMRASR